MSSRRRSPPSFRAIGVASAGVGVACALALPADLLATGGLGVAAVATGSALVLGAPLARLEVELPPAGGGLDEGVRTFCTLWGLALAAALVAPAVTAGGVGGWAGAGLVWLGLAVANRHAFGVVATLVGVLVAAWAVAEGGGPGWTLLEPRWAASRGWAADAIGLGLVLSGAGLGVWSRAPSTRDVSRAPWLATGLAALALALAAAALGGRYERGLPVGLPEAVLAFPAVAAPTLGTGSIDRRGAHALAGLVATWWFAGVGADSREVFLTSMVLLGPLVAALRLALRGSGTARLVAAAVALGAGAAAVVSFPGVPANPWGATATAMVPVVGFWIAATRGLLARQEAR